MLAELNAICYTLNAMSKIYGLIFDVDGVIADTEAVNARVSIKVFADLAQSQLIDTLHTEFRFTQGDIDALGG